MDVAAQVMAAVGARLGALWAALPPGTVAAFGSCVAVGVIAGLAWELRRPARPVVRNADGRVVAVGGTVERLADPLLLLQRVVALEAHVGTLARAERDHERLALNVAEAARARAALEEYVRKTEALLVGRADAADAVLARTVAEVGEVTGAVDRLAALERRLDDFEGRAATVDVAYTRRLDRQADRISALEGNAGAARRLSETETRAERSTAGGVQARMTEEELAAEARRWDDRKASPHDWQDAPEKIPSATPSLFASRLASLEKNCAAVSSRLDRAKLFTEKVDDDRRAEPVGQGGYLGRRLGEIETRAEATAGSVRELLDRVAALAESVERASADLAAARKALDAAREAAASDAKDLAQLDRILAASRAMRVRNERQEDADLAWQPPGEDRRP